MALAAHPDQRFREYIVRGIRDGFRLGFSYPNSCTRAKKNMMSAEVHAQVVGEYLAEECAKGRVIGPLDIEALPAVQISRFGVIPKAAGKWRLIVDLSSPEGASVNDGIQEKICSLAYVTVEQAGKEVVRQGQGTLLAKLDIKSAYRIVPVHPDDRWLLGMRWQGALFVPFGLRSAPKIFTAIADAAEWIMKQEGVEIVEHYLDDFLLMGAPGSQQCGEALATVVGVCERLGLPIAEQKTVGPVPRLTFLGIEMDTWAMELRLPRGKLVELKVLVHQWLGKRRACKREELESLVGKLAHACKVVPPGKTFMRRMFELLAGTRRAGHHIRISRSDM